MAKKNQEQGEAFGVIKLCKDERPQYLFASCEEVKKKSARVREEAEKGRGREEERQKQGKGEGTEKGWKMKEEEI